MSDKLRPFADNDSSLGVGGLTIENGDQRIAVYGNLDLSRDKVGLEAARALKTLLTDVVRALEADKALPDALAPTPEAAPDSGGFDLPTGGLAKP